MSPKSGRKLIEEGLRRNKVEFYVGDDYNTVTLISHPQYLEVVVTSNKATRNSLCYDVVEVLKYTLHDVTSRMNYDFRMEYQFGFECPDHPGRHHFCVLAKDDAKKMECLENRQKIRPISLKAQHKEWFSASYNQPAHSFTG